MLAAIARPYAKAAFEYAEEHHCLSEWLDFLRALAFIAKDRAVKKLLLNPQMTKEKLITLFSEIVKNLPKGGENFLLLLAEKHRFNALPSIAEIFEQYYSQQEQVLVVDITAASELTALQKTQLTATLKQHFGKSIEMKTHIDANLLGGVVIRADDLVIDGSVRAQLGKMAKELIA